MSAMRRRTVAWGTGLALSVAIAGCRAVTAPRSETAAGSITAPWLSAPVKVVTDRDGIPHLRASNLSDLYFAWGWVTARDRLWQLELTRLRARGLSHQWLGNAVLRADGGAQLFRFEQRAGAIWARERANPAVRVALERFADGVNARIAQVRSGHAPLPPEFAALGRLPLEWRPEDSVMTLLGLGLTLDLDLPELDEADEIRSHGRAWAIARRRFEGAWIYDTIPDSAAWRMWGPAAIAGAAAGDVGDAPHSASPARIAAARARIAALRDAEPGADGRASDCIVVGARRSSSGYPMLANDPHLGLFTPGQLYLVHLSVPDSIEAAGATVPGLPVIASGRSLTCAWGLTALGADVVDAVADSISHDGRSVLWRGRWVPLVVRPYHLAYRVLGVPLPVPGQVGRYTPEGPVLEFDPRHGRALSMRWSAFEDQRITLSGVIGLERSRTAGEIAARARTLVTPTVNLLAADVSGAALYQACGLIPRRSANPGLGILPGGGASSWPGYIAPDSMPSWRVPPGGFAVNGNNRPLSRYPYSWPRYEWAQDRALRMAQRLAGAPHLTPADLASVQNDVYSRAASRFVPALLRCADSLGAALGARERAALDTLRVWDFLARRSRVAPTLYRAWLGALSRRSRTEGLPGLTLAALEGRASDALRAPGTEAAERPALAAARSLSLALDSLSARLGPDLARWSWGRAHLAHFRHALGATRAGAGADPRWEPPLTPEDGDNSTPCVGPSRLPWSLEVTHGPVFRHIVDLGNRRVSWAVVPPGNPAGSSALLERWADHGYVPLRLDWALVAEAAVDSVTLAPAGR